MQACRARAFTFGIKFLWRVTYGTTKFDIIILSSFELSLVKEFPSIEYLLDHNLDFITDEEFKSRYQIKINFLTYYGVINAIPNEYKKSIKQTNAQQEQPTQQSQSLKANNQGYT